MAELLLRLGDIKSDLNAWQRFYPVAVFEDGHVWGGQERPPKFLVVRFVGVSAADLQQYLETDSAYTDAATPIMLALRKWKIDIEDARIPNVVKKKIRNAIADGTILEVTMSQIAAYIKRTR